MSGSAGRMAQLFNLTDFIDVATLSQIQSRCAEATGVEFCFYDRCGRRITVPGEPQRFCSALGTAGAGRQDVLGQNLLGAYRSTSVGPFQACCEAQRYHAAWPITSGQQLLGMLVMSEEATASAGIAPSHPGGQAAPAARAQRGWGRPASPAAGLAELMASLLGRLCYQQQQMQLRVEELTALYSVTGLLAGAFDLQQVLDEIASRVCQVMRVKACSLRLLDEQTGELVIKAGYNLSDEYIRKGPVRINENPIDAAALSGQTVYIEDAPNDPRTRYPEQARKEGIVSGLVAGMFYHGKPIGVLRVYTGTKHRFSGFEAGLLRAMAAQAAAAIETARLYQEELQAEMTRRQLRVASDVQRRMIPAQPPAHQKLTFGTVYEPSLDVGGDFFDFVEFPGGRVGVVIADVVGKGVPAALMMASVRSALRANAYTGRSVEKVVQQVNRHMCRDTLVSEFATLFYCVVSRGGRRLTYCSAGHDPPLMLRKGKIRELDESGLVIGIHPDERYVQKHLLLRPGDVILLYTDGVVEAVNFEDEQFGRERLRASLSKYGHLDAQGIVTNILWDVRRFVGLAEQSDDLTMVAIKVRA